MQRKKKNRTGVFGLIDSCFFFVWLAWLKLIKLTKITSHGCHEWFYFSKPKGLPLELVRILDEESCTVNEKCYVAM
jgi:hypothetical protein